MGQYVFHDELRGFVYYGKYWISIKKSWKGLLLLWGFAGIYKLQL